MKLFPITKGVIIKDYGFSIPVGSQIEFVFLGGDPNQVIILLRKR